MTSPGPGPYTFRAVVPTDRPMLERWLQSPEIVLWWGDLKEQGALLASDLKEPRMTMRIVAYKSRPCAYAQDYAVHDWPQPQFSQLPEAARAIDAFVGEPDMIGKGHASIFLRLLAERLRHEGAPLVAIDPNLHNIRARRAYENAGFSGNIVVATAAGPAILMRFEP